MPEGGQEDDMMEGEEEEGDPMAGLGSYNLDPSTLQAI